ncbi:MurR/RpiR family transcriptional regulator [Streptomyces sp. AJS327]|uniref:MurR/RpiR family transcriptional regulator n=1 Tax=Streptomyces sp. AJS327 TaxID=2545265 RepID=UPI0015E045E1|nr:MurR/RpiR family transcriptional regulator [Streptomyces sp. AJS327]MBA0049958.1 MurR/RpiR family transcriptional regulator [Streptomyces sp. AJS327]
MRQIVDRLRALEPELPEAQRALAALILEDPASVAERTILELAETAEVSTGSITRLCRTLGLAGYSQLRLALAAEQGARSARNTWQGDVGTDISEHDSLRRVAEAVVGAVSEVVARSVEGVDLVALEEVATRLAAARRVELFGVGGSATVAGELQHRLYRIGVPAWSWSDAHVALTGAALLGPGDVVVVLSHSGGTRESCDVLAEAVSRGATTVAVTNDPGSPLARHAELTLATRVRAVGLSTEAVLARHAQMAVLDVLYIAVAQRTYDSSTEAMAATTEAVRPYRHRS